VDELLPSWGLGAMAAGYVGSHCATSSPIIFVVGSKNASILNRVRKDRSRSSRVVDGHQSKARMSLPLVIK